MNEQMKEQLSTFIDGEVSDDDAIINNLVKDGTAKEVWLRYSIISDVMHRRTPMQADAGLSSRISALVGEAPVVLAPEPVKYPAYLRPVAGFAIAASVAALAILGIQHYQSDVVPVDTGPASIARAPVTVSGGQADTVARAVPASPRPVVQTVTQPVVQMEIQFNPRMSRYLLNHNEFQSSTGVQGVMPYVRLVATDANQ